MYLSSLCFLAVNSLLLTVHYNYRDLSQNQLTGHIPSSPLSPKMTTMYVNGQLLQASCCIHVEIALYMIGASSSHFLAKSIDKTACDSNIHITNTQIVNLSTT